MDYFFLKFRSVFNRVKYLTLLVLLYIAAEHRLVTMNGAKGKWWVFAVFYVIDIFFFYFNCYFVYPRAYENRKTVYKPVAFVLLAFSLHYLTSISAHTILFTGIISFFDNFKRPVFLNYSWRVLQIGVFSAIPFGFFTYIKMIKRERALESNALYSRVSPHLIFNSLNFIHSELRSISPKADEMIICLSQYSRYAMADLAEDGKANLEAELAQLDILIKMMELRYDIIYISKSISTSEPVYDYRIPPSLILTVAENLFKHGIINDPNRPGIIEVFDQGKLLHVKVCNWKANIVEGISHSIGHDNLKKRLNNIYGDFFTLKIDDKEDHFSVHIIIPA